MGGGVRACLAIVPEGRLHLKKRGRNSEPGSTSLLCSSVTDPTILTMHILQISAVVCAFISLFLLLIALGSDYWVAGSNYNSGLWTFCKPIATINMCYPLSMLPTVPGYMHATRAFMFFGMIAGAVSCLGLCSTFFSFQLGPISKNKSSAVASLIAAVCILIGMATFTGQTGSNTPYGWSFGLGWASFPLFLITSGLAFALDIALSASA